MGALPAHAPVGGAEGLADRHTAGRRRDVDDGAARALAAGLGVEEGQSKRGELVDGVNVHVNDLAREARCVRLELRVIERAGIRHTDVVDELRGGSSG